MTFPHVPITLDSRWPFVLLDPRKIRVLHEISNCDDSVWSYRSAVDSCNVILGFGLDVRRWIFSPGGNRAKRMGYSFSLNRSAYVSPLPISNVPAITDADDLPVLFSVSHVHSLLRFCSRAVTASFAIRFRSAADNFSARA